MDKCDVLNGKGVSPGIAIGCLHFIEESVLPTEKKIIDNVPDELERLKKACAVTVAQLDAQAENMKEKLGEDKAALFHIHAMMVEDEDYQEAITAMIASEHVCAEFAVLEAGKKFASLFSSMDDAYMGGRASDVMDVSHRIIRNLGAGTEKSIPDGMLMIRSEADNTSIADRQAERNGSEAEVPVILAASDFTPSETARFDRSEVLAFVTQQGTETSHTAIFARTIGIPAVVGIGKELDRELNGSLVIVDGTAGRLYVRPDDALVEDYRKQMEQQSREREALEKLRGMPTVTKKGQVVKLCANIGSVEDAHAAVENDAEGIGLFRSEFLFLRSRTVAPDEEMQFNAYRKVIRIMNGRSIIIRTLDIGADKQVAYLNLENEANPALGLRALRLCLKRPEIFKTQLRAIYRASAFGPVSIMLPMVNSLHDVRRAQEIARQVCHELAAEHKDFSAEVPLGIMIETPAAAVISDLLAKEVDFFSIGTNDLTQYALAVDRQNDHLEEFRDPHHEAVLRLIRMTVENAHRAGIWTGICGALAADTEMTRFFVETGVDELSVTPSDVLKIRRIIREL